MVKIQNISLSNLKISSGSLFDQLSRLKINNPEKRRSGADWLFFMFIQKNKNETKRQLLISGYTFISSPGIIIQLLKAAEVTAPPAGELRAKGKWWQSETSVRMENLCSYLQTLDGVLQLQVVRHLLIETIPLL